MLFLCVNLFDKGRPIEGRVPSQALAVAVAAGQLSGQEQQHSHHQPVHHGHGGQSLVLQVAWSGPGGLYGPTWALAMCAPHGPTNSTGRLLHGRRWHCWDPEGVDTWWLSICPLAQLQPGISRVGTRADNLGRVGGRV